MKRDRVTSLSVASLIILLVLATVSPNTLAASTPDQSPITGNLAPAYVGTDYTVTIRGSGLLEPRLIIEFSGKDVPVPFTPTGVADLMSATIPGYMIEDTGTLRIKVIDAARGSHALIFKEIPVLRVPASARTGEDETSIQATGPSRWFYDVDQHGYKVNGVDISNLYTQIKSPARQSDPDPDKCLLQERWPQLNNGHNQPRPGDLTNPHRGLDIDIRTNENVCAVLGGIVEYAQGSTVHTKHDLDGNGSTDIYVKYEHLAGPRVSRYQSVSTTTLIGKIGSSNHLHIRFDNSSHLSMPQYVFWKDAAAWGYGKDVDFIQKPVESSSTISVKILGWNVGSSVYAENVYIFHRKWGSSSAFTGTPMTNPSGDKITWVKDLTPYYSRYDIVEFYIQAERKGLNEPNKKVFRPAFYNLYKDASGNWVATPPEEYFYMDID